MAKIILIGLTEQGIDNHSRGYGDNPLCAGLIQLNCNLYGYYIQLKIEFNEYTKLNGI